VAKWASAHRFSQWWHIWPLAARQYFSPPLGGHAVQLGVHFVGGGVPIDLTQPAQCIAVHGHCRRVSFFGFLVFWIESLFLGLADESDRRVVL